METGTKRTRAKRRGRVHCPVCGTPAVPDFRPFCSARCAEVDLGRWLKGLYRVPAEEAADEGAPPPEDED